MGFSNFSPLGVLIAALLAFAFGFGWHRALEKSWMTR